MFNMLYYHEPLLKIYAILFQLTTPYKLCYCLDSQVFKYNSVFIIGIRHAF